jgi:DNA repair protein RadD
VHHSQHVCAAFNAAGIRALHLDANSPPLERKHAAKLFAMGIIKVLTNVALFGEGYDLAAQAEMDVTVDCVGLARPTASLALHLQQVGRALRPKDYPAMILDHAGNLLRHGLPDDDREWSLDGQPKKAKDAENAGKRCPECFGVHKPTMRTCPYCGHVYAATAGAGAAQIQTADGELEEIDVVAARRARVGEERACRDVGELAALARRRGYQHPEAWAARIWGLRDRKAQFIAEERARQYGLRV